MMIEIDNLKSRIAINPDGKRVYLISLHADDLPVITDYLDKISASYGLTKIFVKVRSKFNPLFCQSGYTMEAFVPGYYNGQEDAFFMAKYFDDERRLPEKEALRLFQEMLIKAIGKDIKQIKPPKTLYKVRLLNENHAEEITSIFKCVFKTYPFPVFDSQYLIQTMQEGTRYYGIFQKNELIAVSSAECDERHQSAEMTDFAVLPAFRGKRLALVMLDHMERDLYNLGYIALFTIARLHELSMNKTFLNAGYNYSGTLTKNTQIAGKIESMNVWYKHLIIMDK